MAEEIDRMHCVDTNPKAHSATVENEEAILCDTYGPADSEGIYGAKED